MRNKTLTRIIIATLLCALLVNAGRATRAFALALPAEPIQPIYETEVIALYDYVSNNLEQNVPQLDIFFLLSGALAVAQLGAQDALLESPYPNESSVKEWLINCGIQLYNSVIGLVPSGDYYVNIPLVGQPDSAVKGIPRSMIKALVAQMMGNAVVARNYSSVDDFLNDDAQHLMPFQRDLQVSINAIWQLQGGPYHWQFTNNPWTSNFNWNHYELSVAGEYSYNQYLEQYSDRNPVHANYQYDSTWTVLMPQKYDLFLNTSNGTLQFVNSNGTSPVSTLQNPPAIFASSASNVRLDSTQYVWFYVRNLNLYSGNTYLEIVKDALNSYNDLNKCLAIAQRGGPYMPLDNAMMINNVYVGTNWINKQLLENLGDLNISEDMDDYYRSPDQDVYIDIKDLIENLVNKTSIWDFLIDHLFDIDGNLIIPNFPTFSVDLTPITDLLAPPIPVDLNDIALYTDNDYLEEVKERSRKFGETIGEYFVFWHNSDPVTVYVIFGSFIVILVGAFIGKWGHS